MPNTPSKDEAGELVEIGGSPAPGLRLTAILQGQSGNIQQIVWSPDGRYLAAPSVSDLEGQGGTVRVWDIGQGGYDDIHRSPEGMVNSVAFAPDSNRLVIASGEHRILLCVIPGRERTQQLSGHAPIRVWSVAWSTDGKYIAAGSQDGRVNLWNAQTRKLFRVEEAISFVKAVAFSPQNQCLAYACGDGTIGLITGPFGQTLRGHTKAVWSLSWSPNGQYIASASADTSIRIWDGNTGRALKILEGHSDWVVSVRFSGDGKWLASKSSDGTVRLWRCDTWVCVASFDEVSRGYAPGLAFHPQRPLLATLGSNDTLIRLWELDEELLRKQAVAQERRSVHYTTAKVVLLGDSGVGKTGLGWRLSHDEFREHASTHGQQFWALPQLGRQRADGTQCEAVLWDLAGQPVYRQVHSIFLDNVALALVLFDPSNRQDPLKGAQFWLEQLRGKGELPPTILVGARIDRGGPGLSRAEIDQFCQRYGILGGYVGTSARRGDGLAELWQRLQQQIPWEAMTATVTTVTFKRIKDFVLSLKEQTDRGRVLVAPAELRARLEDRLTEEGRPLQFSDAELLTAVGHLETHGYVALLRSSDGELHILLSPEVLSTLAASIVLLADSNPRELGAVSEGELLHGRVRFDELSGLSAAEVQILIDAALQRFLAHNLCFRATLGQGTLLIFPSLIKQKRPLSDEPSAVEGASYVVRGRVENLYASLVVLLGYTPSFTRINQWQHQAQYELGPGEICGFRLIEDREGEIELVLYYGERMPAAGRIQFQELFEEFLYQREVAVVRLPPVDCRGGHRQERATVLKRLREKKDFVFCDECGERIELPRLAAQKDIGISASPWLQRQEALARLRSSYEVEVTRVKSYRRDRAQPRCYVSRLPSEAAWADKLIADLRDAGVLVIEQPGQVQAEDIVLLLDSPEYQAAFGRGELALDTGLVQARLGREPRQLISLSRVRGPSAHRHIECQPGDFSDDTHYPLSLFDLVLNLYAVPFDVAGFARSRQLLHEQWEQTAAHFSSVARARPGQLFISYVREDQAFKDELLTMLASLQAHGELTTWDAQRIAPGDDSAAAAARALRESRVAVLLLSSDFLASPFIQQRELPALLQRRLDEGMPVVPILVRDCPWDSEPTLSQLQIAPQGGRAVIRHRKETGERDQIWSEIARQLAEHLVESPPPDQRPPQRRG